MKVKMYGGCYGAVSRVTGLVSQKPLTITSDMDEEEIIKGMVEIAEEEFPHDSFYLFHSHFCLLLEGSEQQKREWVTGRLDKPGWNHTTRGENQ